MNTHAILLASALLLAGCTPAANGNDKPVPDPDPVVVTDFFAKGADISWTTQMESWGCKFYSPTGVETECTALMQKLGCNSIRLRVWVNPKDGWCGKEDVVVKAKRAQALGMKLLIDFHYGDSWCDPGKQPVPEAWTSYDATKMAQAVADHTKDVLKALKNAGVDVSWVQVGNEVTNGMLWESGRVKGQSAENFCKYFSAGYNAVKDVYPEAQVVLHIDNGWNTETVKWFFNLMKSNNLLYDIIGLSLYPSYWDDSSKCYPDWNTKTKQFTSSLGTYHSLWNKPIMLVEFGMPASEPQKAKEALQYLMDQTSGKDWFEGIFLWEPESEKSRNGYDYGAFSGGKATSAMDPFKN